MRSSAGWLRRAWLRAIGFGVLRCSIGTLEADMFVSQMVFEPAREVFERCTNRGSVEEARSELGVRFLLSCRRLTAHPLQQIENYTIAETVQGQTKRYLIAWSLQSARLNSVGLQHLLSTLRLTLRHSCR